MACCAGCRAGYRATELGRTREIDRLHQRLDQITDVYNNKFRC